MTENNLKVHFSSEKEDWQTPDDFFQGMEKLFGKFEIDAAADYLNTKCEIYFGKDQYGAIADGLIMNWHSKDNSTRNIWLNPPYGRGITGKWVEKAARESLNGGGKTVCLLPARTDTKWFKTCFEQASEIYFVKGRLKFKGAKDSAPFPSMIVVFEPHGHSVPFFKLMNTKGEIIP